jgi:hypothetical protein
MSGRGPFGELAGVAGIFHFHQAGKVANVFDSSRELIVEFPTRGDAIADCIPSFCHGALERCFVGGQVFQKIRRQYRDRRTRDSSIPIGSALCGLW